MISKKGTFVYLGGSFTRNGRNSLLRDLFGEVPHPKGGKVVWNDVDDNIIEDKDENK